MAHVVCYIDGLRSDLPLNCATGNSGIDLDDHRPDITPERRRQRPGMSKRRPDIQVGQVQQFIAPDLLRGPFPTGGGSRCP